MSKPDGAKPAPFEKLSCIEEIVNTEMKDIKRLFPTYIYEEGEEQEEGAVADLKPQRPFNFRTPPKPRMKITSPSGEVFLTPFDASWWDGIEWFFAQLKWSPKKPENAL